MCSTIIASSLSTAQGREGGVGGVACPTRACALLALVLSGLGRLYLFRSVTLPLWAVIGSWRTARVHSLLGFGLCGPPLQFRLSFLACFDIIDRSGFLAVRALLG